MFSARLLFCLLITPVFVFSQPGFSEDSFLVKYGFGDELSLGRPSFLIDSANASSFGQIQSDSFFLSKQKFIRGLFQPSGSAKYWLKFPITNTSDSALDIQLYAGEWDYMDCYFVPGKGPVIHRKGGTLQGASPKNLLANEMSGTFPFSLSPGQHGFLFLGIRQRTRDFSFKGVQLLDNNHLNAYIMQSFDSNTRFVFFQALFQGFLLCQILYVLFQWLLIRRSEYLYYFSYLVLISLYFLSKYESLFGIRFLFTQYPILILYLSKTLQILPYFLYFRFVRSFLEMPVHFPKLNKWIIPLEYFLLFYLVFDFLFIVITLDEHTQALISTLVLSIVFLFSVCFIIYMFRSRKTLVNYILSGSLFVGLGNICGSILSYLIINKHFTYLDLHQMMLFPETGIVLEICCFSAGLSYKRKASEKEKIQDQQKLIEQLKANELLRLRLEHIRNKIAQDLHDDIGSTLSSISILSDLAMKERDSVQTMATMQEINSHSIQLMERMDDIVWSINPKNDTLENLMIRIKHFATTLFEARNIDYDIRIQPEIHRAGIPMEYRQHVYLILKETINNLVKYASATKAGIHIRFDEQNLFLEIRDNGKGFETSLPFSGNGIYGMQNRAKQMNASLEIRSAPGRGTALLLTIPFS